MFQSWINRLPLKFKTIAYKSIFVSLHPQYKFVSIRSVHGGQERACKCKNKSQLFSNQVLKKNRIVCRDAAGISNPGGLAVMWWA